MRWFGGHAPGKGFSSLPVGAGLLWTSPPLWLMGPWRYPHIKATENETGRIAVIGPCSANEDDLRQALQAAELGPVTTNWAGSFTVIRQVKGSVEIVTDVSGACPVYTARTNSGSVVWASSSRALAGLIGAEVDPVWLAAHLGDRHAVPRDHSAWAGISLVPPGHRLCLEQTRMTVTRWWQPLTRMRDDALERTRWALVEGVRSRADGTRVSTDLSGVDSATLSSIASRSGPVVGVTAHPEGADTGGDLDFVNALNLGGLTRKRLSISDRYLPFSPGTEAFAPTDEPPPSAVSWGAFSAQLAVVSAARSECHLTGDGGDNLFLPPPTHLSDLARHRRWGRLWGDACGWARLRRRSPWPYVRSALAGDLTGLGSSAPLPPPWLLKSAPKRPAVMSADAALVDLINNVARAASSDIQLADQVGVEQHNPYFDGALLDAVVSVPSADRFSARRYKPALMDAVGDLVPAVVRDRTTKGTFVADYHRAVRANLHRVLEKCEGPLSDMGLVDAASLRSTVHAAALGARVPWGHLLTTLGTQLWLESIQTAPALRWNPIQEIVA